MASTTEHIPTSQARPGFRRVLGWSVRSGKLPALAIFLLSIWLLYDSLSSERFVVRTIKAEGIQALTEQDVRELAGVTKQSVWVLDEAAVEANVARSPYVERVRAQVQLPDTVLVRVSERRPEVRWMHSGTTFDVTWEGLVLAGSAPDTLAFALPSPATAPDASAGAASGPEFVNSIQIIDTTPNRALKPGDYVDRDALEVARRVSLRAAELPLAMERIEWDAGLGVSLIVGQNQQVVLGKSERLDEKFAILAQLLRENTAFSYLDLRSTTPFYR